MEGEREGKTKEGSEWEEHNPQEQSGLKRRQGHPGLQPQDTRQPGLMPPAIFRWPLGSRHRRMRSSRSASAMWKFEASLITWESHKNKKGCYHGLVGPGACHAILETWAALWSPHSQAMSHIPPPHISCIHTCKHTNICICTHILNILKHTHTHTHTLCFLKNPEFGYLCSMYQNHG